MEFMALNKVKAAKSVIYPAPAPAGASNHTHIYLPDGKVIHRDKRYLIFAGGGVSKVSIE